MQFYFSTLLPLAAVVTAARGELIARQNSSECTTGTISYCNSTYNANSSEAISFLELFDIADQDPKSFVGVGCKSWGDSVGGGSPCQQQLLCCNDNRLNGSIVIACDPIIINIYPSS